MQKTKTTIIQKEDEMDSDNSPGVVAFRVRKLEEAQKESLIAQQQGFDRLSTQLQEYKDTLVSQQMFAEAKANSEEKHKELDERITALENFKDKVISRLALGAILFLIAVVLVVAGLDKYANVIK